MLIGKVAAKNLPDTPYNLITEKKDAYAENSFRNGKNFYDTLKYK